MPKLNIEKIKVIGFDADDTLWVNEPYYRETEDQFCQLLSRFATVAEINKKLFEIEIANLELYGYGTKAFILSLIETAIIISDGKVSSAEISKIVNLGKAQINIFNPLLTGVNEVLAGLAPHFKLIVATKGDLLDQERKLKNSGIAEYFQHIEIMSDKTEENYSRLLRFMDIKPDEFLMVGNSVKSDILPVTNLGGYAVHVPYHITWQHEELLPEEMPNSHFYTVKNICDILKLLDFETINCKRV